MTVELGDLEWAITAAQHRSLRQAAEALNIRQSTLSRRLRDLESQLGAALFMRTNGGTRPTIAGQEFLEAARRIVKEVDSITVRFRVHSRGESGRLTIGTHTSLSTGNLRATIVEHRQRFPEVETSFVDGCSDHLISDLAGAAIDVAFVASDVSGWEEGSLPVWSERVVVALPASHSLSGRDFVRWDELRNEPMLMHQRGPGAELLKLLAGKIGYPDASRVLRQDIGLDRLLTLVGAGWGIMLALEGATAVSCPGVIFREVHDLKGPSRLNFSAYWREANNNPSLGPFLAILRERYPDLSGDTA